MLEKLSIRSIYLAISLILLIVCIINKGFITANDILETNRPNFSDKNLVELIKGFEEEIDRSHPKGFVNVEDATSYLIGNMYGITKGIIFDDDKALIDRLNKFYNRYYQIGFGLHYADFVSIKIAPGAKRVEKKFLGVKYYKQIEGQLPISKYIKDGDKGIVFVELNYWSLIPINIHYYMLSPIFYVSLIFFLWSFAPIGNFFSLRKLNKL